MTPPRNDEEFDRRFAKVEKARAAGNDPYPVRFDRDRTIAELREAFDGLEPGAETEVSVRVAGRLMLIRRQGKLTFGTLRDGTGCGAAVRLPEGDRARGAVGVRRPGPR